MLPASTENESHIVAPLHICTQHRFHILLRIFPYLLEFVYCKYNMDIL